MHYRPSRHIAPSNRPCISCEHLRINVHQLNCITSTDGYDSTYAANWASTDDMLDTHVEAGILLQGLRRAVEQEGVNVHFIKVKGHMDDHKGFIDKFRCAKGNWLADDYASKGMKEETTQMPYKMQELPLYISGETTTR